MLGAALLPLTSSAAPPGITLTAIQLSHNQFFAGPGSHNQFIGYVVLVGQMPYYGQLSLTGPDAASFKLSGTLLYVGPFDLSPGTYSITVQSQ